MALHLIVPSDVVWVTEMEDPLLSKYDTLFLKETIHLGYVRSIRILYTIYSSPWLRETIQLISSRERVILSSKALILFKEYPYGLTIRRRIRSFSNLSCSFCFSIDVLACQLSTALVLISCFFFFF